ncbi:fungal-specific transcription factor domain-containing protein [Dichomitus squalens]|uniref:Fungal-specific transcription factor domain-containing protein n=1 Tax=Dichomitus squalens TaxID=114155 RepID=A0A4Q9QBV8_9APHY|nr:fungal-specific transcription factor domain-containing protein [Dichomitus squalens]
MSSPEEDYNDGDISAQNAKKRRIQRACDMCRRKKIRCDGAQMPNNRCSNCVSYRLECTYIEAAKKRGPPKGYVESLETRLEKMERLLNKLCPNADFTKELGGSFDKDGWLTDRNGEPSSATTTKPAYSIPANPTQQSAIASPPALSSSAQVESDDLDPSDDEIVAQRNIVQSLRKMSMNPSSMRYHGKSSSLLFIQTAMDLKQEYAGLELPKTVDADTHHTLLRRRHQQYWSLHPWLTSNVQDEHAPHKDFPPPDLLEKLIDLYFKNMNDYMPLLHRPTFEQGVKEGLHLHDEGFGSTVLLVCANGSRFTDDRRVLLDDSQIPQSAGWKWFQQVQMVRKSLLAPPRLYDLQIYALTAGFLQGTSAPQACWTIIGVGIRMAQDVGAHRKKVYSSSPTIEEELWRRAFWVLVAMDRAVSFGLGRPCAIQDEDFDIDLPTECDDEYWTNPDPELAFKQSPGQPSKVAFFNCALRLHQILAFAMRTIYSINKSKALLGFVGQQWEQHIVAELDSALNKWIDSVPDHLRWDPTRENLLFLNQSANLYANYYQLQIAVHRPFIPSPRKPSPLSFPSLAICTNAARSCIHVLDVQYKRSGMPMYSNQMALFTAGIVLLLNIWGGKRSGLSTDPAKEMADVHKCMKMLQTLEPHWHTAGRLWDILYELASVGDLPLPQASPTPNHKRERDADSPTSCVSVTSNASRSQTVLDGPRTIAGSRRVSKDVSKDAPSLAAATFAQPLPRPQPPVPSSSDSEMPSATSSRSSTANGNGSAAGPATTSFVLPVHTDELGRLPLHPGLDASYSDWPQHAQQRQEQQLAAVSRRAGMSSAQFDPRAMPMYTLQPASFNEMINAAASEPSAFAQMPSEMHLAPTITPGTAGAAQGSMAQGPPISSEEMAFTDNTLAMWSNAPTSFEWDDWGTYINNVSGMHNPPGSAPPPPGHGQT